MRNIFLLLIFFLLGIHSALGDDMLLDYKDVQFFKIREIRSTHTVSLELSGLAFHSSLAVEKIETKTESGCMIVFVHLVKARSGLTGNFTFILDVPEKTDCVCFGAAKQIIWKRGIGPVNK